MPIEEPKGVSQPVGESEVGQKSRIQLFLCLSAQLIFTGLSIVLGFWIRLAPFSLAGVCLSGVAAMAGTMAEGTQRTLLIRWSKRVVAANLLLIPAALLFPRIHVETLDYLYAVIAWTIGASVFVPYLFANELQQIGTDRSEIKARAGSKQTWRVLAVIWGILGTLTWLAASYLQNQAIAFHVGLVITVVLMLLARLWFRLPVALIQVAHTVILVCILLPIVDFLFRPSNRLDEQPQTRKRYYSFDVARKNPVAFTRWWKYYNEQWDQLMKQIAARDPSDALPFFLRPGSSGEFFQSHITINSNGFRGKEISVEKGDAFRIVAIGESTTFGVTMNVDDKPWPELLEEMIRTRLKAARPVEVINAGVPAHTLEHTLKRFEREILPLKPDMIVCYHGFNGLYLLNDIIPHMDRPRPPKYQPRPLKLLADMEQRLKMAGYRTSLVGVVRRDSSAHIDPMTSRYAQAYRNLIQATRTNHIRLAIATFSMAANSKSEPAVMEFYRPAFPAVHWQVQANVLHAIMVRQLARENQGVDLVDTQPRLDGYHEKFIDLMHLTQEGRQEVAEAFFAGINRSLQEGLTSAP